MYHSHHNAAEQVTRGLLGAFIIAPQDSSQDPAYDSDYTLVLNDAGTGWSNWPSPRTAGTCRSRTSVTRSTSPPANATTCW